MRVSGVTSVPFLASPSKVVGLFHGVKSARGGDSINPLFLHIDLRRELNYLS